MMQHFLAPYFYSAVKVLNASEKDGVKPTQKAVVDLETLLTHLQQDTDIPQIELIVDVTIAEAVAKVPSSPSRSVFQLLFPISSVDVV